MTIANTKAQEYFKVYELVLNIFYNQVIDLDSKITFDYIKSCLDDAASIAYIKEIITESEWETFDNRQQFAKTNSSLAAVEELKMEEVICNCFNYYG